MYQGQQRVVCDEEMSSWVPVTSGVPQVSVIGPILFLVYMNSQLNYSPTFDYLFADDTIVYMAATNETDAAILQKDLKLLEEWENRSQMFFHPHKSHGAGSPSPMITSYTTRSLRKKMQLNILASLYTISCLGTKYMLYS